MPAAGELMPWSSPGIGTGRAWVYAPERATLGRRWERLAASEPDGREALLVPTRARGAGSAPSALPGCAPSPGPLARDVGPVPRLVRVARRPFDRQWLLADHRVIDAARPQLWRVRGGRQVYLSVRRAQDAWPLLCTALLPDAAHHEGRAGRVLPLYRDPDGTRANLVPGLTALLADRLGVEPAAEDVFAWIVAATEDPARVPLTADPDVWAEGVRIGRRLVWLHTFGARFGEPEQGRPRLPGGRRPFVREIVPPRPDGVDHDDEGDTLVLGTGRIGPVAREVWDLGVIGPWVAARVEPVGVGLERVRERAWSTDLSGELIDLVHVLGLIADLAGPRAALRSAIAASPGITRGDLLAAGVLPAAPAARRPPTVLDASEEGPGGQAVLI